MLQHDFKKILVEARDILSLEKYITAKSLEFDAVGDFLCFVLHWALMIFNCFY